MKRYTMWNDPIVTEDLPNATRDPDGDWVRHSDIQELQHENARLKHLFELQHERSVKADKLWREATGNTGTPDLGVLLAWFMDERTEIFRVMANIRRELEGVIK